MIHKCDIVFLIGTTDNYYENGELKTAQRQTSEDQTIETDSKKTDKYTVHPAFTNESKINYANGGWDKELAGIWVAKFEAGYASGNNKATPTASSVNYSQKIMWVAPTESKTDSASNQPARNWLDGEYAIKNGTTYEWKEGKETSIKYPTFQGLTYSMNYINHNDAYKISRVLTEDGNIYKLSKDSTDSHLMKNSEWGAVAYLSQSKYGLNGANIAINNVTLRNSETSIYAVTGCSGDTADAEILKTTILAINKRTQEGVSVWTQKSGTKSSSTGTIYGIYDLSGGTAERTAAIINNGHRYLTSVGRALLNNGKSSKYVTVYPHDSNNDNTTIEENEDLKKLASFSNYEKNTKIYGDAIKETAIDYKKQTSWYSNYMFFPSLSTPFFVRSGNYWIRNRSGLFFEDGNAGGGDYSIGFRSVLVSL